MWGDILKTSYDYITIFLKGGDLNFKNVSLKSSNYIWDNAPKPKMTVRTS